MRILLWTASFLPTIGGLEWFVHDLASQLLTMGHDVFVLDGNANASHEEVRQEYIDNIPVMRIPCPSPASAPEADILRQIEQLRSFMRRVAPQVVNVQFLGQQCFYALRLQDELGFRLVATAVGSDLNTLHLRSRSRLSIVRNCLAKADAFTACSQQLLSLGEQLAPAIRDHSHLIPTGVKGIFFDRPVSCSTTSPYLLACGRLAPVKGFDLLLQAISLIGVPTRPRLLIAGDGPERSVLEQIISRLHLSEDVELLGFREPHEVAELMHRCLFVVIPSRQEGLPLVALEAMASGRAVVAAAVGGLIEVIRPGINGILVTPDSPSELATAIEQLVSEPRILAEMGVHGRETALTYRMEAIAARYCAIFEKAIQLQQLA